MKLYPNQLAKHLKSDLAPVYFISGDDPLQVQEARDEIIQKARKKGFSGHDLHQVGTSFNWEILYAATHSLSLFDDKSIIELRLSSAKPGKTGTAALVDYCQNPVPDKLLLIIAPKLESATGRAKWVKTIEDTGVLIPVWPIDAKFLPKWVEDRLKSADLQTDRTGIKIIIDATEGNLLASAQEIEKLRLLYGPGRLSSEQIASAIADNARFDVFKLVDTIHSQQSAQVLRVISRLRQEGCEPTILLWALTREIRLLANIQQLLKQGESSANAMKKNGVWDKRQPLIAQSLRKHSLPNLYDLLNHAGNVDRAIKGLKKANVWDELTKLAVQMC